MCKNAHHSETVIWETWWFFACCFRIQLLGLEWNNLSPMLYIQLHSWPMPLEASHLRLFSLGHCFKKSLKTLLTPISSELMMPSLAGAFCSKRNAESYYEPADSYYLCRYSRKKSIGLSLNFNINAVSRGGVKWRDESLLNKSSQFGYSDRKFIYLFFNAIVCECVFVCLARIIQIGRVAPCHFGC